MEKTAIDYKITKPVETEFSRYEPIRYECNPSVPTINFPIDFSKVNKMRIKLSEKQKEIIQKNGFVLSEGNSPLCMIITQKNLPSHFSLQLTCVYILFIGLSILS